MCNGAQSWRSSREATGACIQISFHYRDWEGRGGIRMCSITPTWLIHCTVGKKSTTLQLKNQHTASWNRPRSTTSVTVTVTHECYLCSLSAVEGQGECWWKHRLKFVPCQGFLGAVTMVAAFHLLPFPTFVCHWTDFFYSSLYAPSCFCRLHNHSQHKDMTHCESRWRRTEMEH